MNHLIVLVGPPGSGKSTVAQYYVETHGYYRVSQDDQGKDHMTHFYGALSDGVDIVVDRMNFNKIQRERYIKPAKEHSYHITIKVIHEPRQVCMERMEARKGHPTVTTKEDAVNALNTFFSKYERPTQDEADYLVFSYPLGAKDEAIICDLDGTLCNIDHRLPLLKGEDGKKDWKAFFDYMKQDTPNEWCDAILRHSPPWCNIVLASGRPDNYYKQTKEWLEEHAINYNKLFMRCRGDHRRDDIAKEIILDFEILTRYKPLFFIDDRQQVVDLWRRRGFVCLQCAPGDF